MQRRHSTPILSGLVLLSVFGTIPIYAQEAVVSSAVAKPAVEYVVEPMPTMSPQPINATTVKWVHKYGPARRAGTQQRKPVMLFLTMDGCLHCKRMEHTVFTDANIAKNLNQKFVPARVKLNGTSKLAQDLKVTVFPTTVFIAPDGRILDYVRGYMPSQKFRDHMDQVAKQQTASLRAPPK